jgi:O-antigen/teichoic acid export membrane protein
VATPLNSRREHTSQVVREGTDHDRRGHASSRQRADADASAAGTAARVSRQRPSHTGAEQHYVAPDSVVLSAEAHRARQQAGLETLLAIASHFSLGVSEAATTVIPPVGSWPAEELGTGGSRRVLPRAPERPADGTRRSGSLVNRLRDDHLVRSSLVLMLNSSVQAALGFTFWVVMARLFSAEDVGIASSLISATSLIAFFALAGLNSTLVRFLPTAPDKRSLLTGAFLTVAGAGAVIGLGYVALMPVVAPRLAFITHSPVMALGFVLLTAAAAVNLLTDAVFIASRRAGLCALTDGAIGGVAKIVFGLAVIGTGAFGLFSASVGGLAAAAIASIVLIMTSLRLRPSLSHPFRALKPLLKFSGANYVANALNLLPSVVVAVVVLDRLGARQAGYYFVAFQMAALLYAAIFAAESAFLSEGSQPGADWRAIRRRSRRLAVALFAPAGVLLIATAHWVLAAFGRGYSVNATGCLVLLAVAVLPMAMANWAWTVLRLSGRLVAVVLTNAVYSAGICVAAWILAPHGLTALAAAWLVGAALAAAVATAVSPRSSGKTSPRHRRDASLNPKTASGLR